MTHDEAREYVKGHLQRVGHRKAEVTERMMARWFNVLNTAVFYGRLDKPKKFEARRLRGVWGRCIHRLNGERRVLCLELNDEFTNRRMFLDVLVHEMVHAWEHQHHTVSGHGKRFMSWKSRIKRTVGLDLLIEACESDYE